MLRARILHGHGRHISGRTACTLGTCAGSTGTARTAGSLIAAGCTGRHAHAALHVGGAHDISTGLGAIEMDGVQQLTEVVLCVGIVEVKQVKVAGGVVQCPTHHRHGLLIEVVNGNQSGAVLCTVSKVLDHLLGGVFLSALKEMGRGSGRKHPVPQHHIADLNGAEQCAVFQFHSMYSFPA